MNGRRGVRAAGLIGTVSKVDVDADGKASGPFLRACVSVEIDKPLHRGVIVKTRKHAGPEWETPNWSAQHRRGRMLWENYHMNWPLGHRKRRKKLQSFGKAAEDSFNSSRGNGRSSSSHPHSDRQSSTERPTTTEPGAEATSPDKPPEVGGGSKQEVRRAGASKPLFQECNEHRKVVVPRKRNSGGKGGATPDLNLPVMETSVVPTGLVTGRIAQLGAASTHAENHVDMQKKQKTTTLSNARLARVVCDDPRQAQ
ncbi:unnamed protein product [Urochloa humidicola]